jgi:hypothetical protein
MASFIFEMHVMNSSSTSEIFKICALGTNSKIVFLQASGLFQRGSRTFG